MSRSQRRRTLFAGAIAVGILAFVTPQTLADEADEPVVEAELPNSGSVLGGDTFDLEVQVPVSPLTFVDGSIASGISALRTKSGQLYTTGANNFGQLGLGDTENRSSLTQVDLPEGKGTQWVYASSAQTMWTVSNVWGNNDFNQYGDKGVGHNLVPGKVESTKVLPFSMAVPVVPGSTPDALTQAGDYTGTNGKQYSVWRNTNDAGVGYDGINANQMNPYSSTWSNCAASRPYAVPYASASPVAAYRKGMVRGDGSIAGSCSDVFYSDSLAHAIIVHANKSGEHSAFLPVFPEYSAGAYQLPDGLFLDLDSKGYFGAAVSANGALYTWGDASTGALGFADATGAVGLSEAIPVPELQPGDKLIKVAAGTNYALALSQNGDVFAWGMNENGQLGTGDREPRVVPTKVASGMSFIMASDSTHSMAIGTDGTAWSWGQNKYGELGLGDLEDRLVPTPITLPAPTPATQVLFGEVEATVTEVTSDPATGLWKYQVQVPAHQAGPVPVAVLINEQPYDVGTHTYTFTAQMSATAQSEVGTSVPVTVQVPAEEAPYVNGITFTATSSEGTRAMFTGTFQDGVASLGTVTSTKPTIITVTGQASAVEGSDVPLSNESDVVVEFIKTPTPTEPPGPSGPAEKPGKNTAPPLVNSGANLPLGIALATLVAGLAAVIVSRITLRPRTQKQK